MYSLVFCKAADVEIFDVLAIRYGLCRIKIVWVYRVPDNVYRSFYMVCQLEGSFAFVCGADD